MRCSLMTRDGVLLGQLELAPGVDLQKVGRALLDGQAAAVAVSEPELVGAVAAPAGEVQGETMEHQAAAGDFPGAAAPPANRRRPGAR